MSRDRPVRALSILRGADAGAARSADPVLDVNAYAVADDIELTLVLKDRGVELAVSASGNHPIEVAGVAVPVATPTEDLRGLLDSGVRVVAVREDLERRGLEADRLLPGVHVIDESTLAAMVIEHDVVLAATS